MDERYIQNPKPLIDDTAFDDQKNVKRLFMGSGTSGIIFDITKKGIEVNGYYEGHEKGVKYANLLKPVFIPWKEVDKMREASGKKKGDMPAFVDASPDEEYLAALPVVHLNGKKYYIDGFRRERRSVDNPKDVYKF